MYLHHIGYVFPYHKNKVLEKKFNKKLIDLKQNNYIYFSFSKKFNLWLEYIVPINNRSTVYKYSLKMNKGVHHYAFYTDQINIEKNKLIKNNYILINNYKIEVPVFGGMMKTIFFF